MYLLFKHYPTYRSGIGNQSGGLIAPSGYEAEQELPG
ncbi:hypothetical protein P865_04605 [Brucella abortus 82]|nr:hypothetical protein M798_08650 [Brucella melitensis ADMAS-G1]ERM87070.1 hypothetical protein P865_04605 [Brucella abortus 82]EXU82593.1 hypothetical protein AX23_12365 [Brucella melitensis 548]